MVMKPELGKLPESLQEAVVYFSDPERVHAFAVALRWPEGISCPRCESKEHSYISTRRIWFCKGCKKQFTVKVGSIYEDSPLGMDKWMMAMWLIINCKNGISSYEIARDLKITQKSAWFMLQRLRRVLQDERTGGKLSGEVEVDETYIGAKSRNMHLSNRRKKITAPGPKDKVPVMGILERGGKVRTFVVPDNRRKNLQPVVREHVEAGSAIFTDELMSYRGLEADYAHQIINHAVEYVRGNVHTNGLENFWSLAKRGLHGTYVSVEPFHLFRYFDEQAFRYNNRKMTDGERFVVAMSQASGKRLTWDQLTGKQLDPQTQVN
jgi:transposase-like protein